MTEYTVTGVRYTMGDGLPIEERSELAKEFIRNLKVGTKVILEAEPDNPVDPNAVLVFVDDKIRGRISREQCLEVHQLLDENMQADAVVSETKEELAFFVTIPSAEAFLFQPQPIQRQLPESPLGSRVAMPFSDEEKILDMLAKRLTSMAVSADTIADFLDKAEHYEPQLDMAICYADDQRLSVVYDRLKQMKRNAEKLGVDKGQMERIELLLCSLRDRVRDSHRRWNKGIEKMFMRHLDVLRQYDKITCVLYEKYCRTNLGPGSFAEADKGKMLAERERLLRWFGSMEWSELRDPRRLEDMAAKLSYLRVSRTEMYDIFGVLLVLEQLDKHLEGYQPATEQHSAAEQQSTTEQHSAAAQPSEDKQPAAAKAKTTPKRKAKTAAKAGKKAVSKPMTLGYLTHGHNGLLRKQSERVVMTFRMWTEWGWIAADASPDDFDHLFEGKPHHCNITWKANSTILTILLQKLMEQTYIIRYAGQSVSAMVREQFGLTPNFDRSRLTETDELRINATIYLLNPDNPLSPRRRGSDEDGQDMGDAILQAIQSGQLRLTKGI